MLPEGFFKLASDPCLELPSGIRLPLRQAPIDHILMQYWKFPATLGIPTAYSMSGHRVYLDPTPDDEYNITIEYFEYPKMI